MNMEDFWILFVMCEKAKHFYMTKFFYKRVRGTFSNFIVPIFTLKINVITWEYLLETSVEN